MLWHAFAIVQSEHLGQLLIFVILPPRLSGCAQLTFSAFGISYPSLLGVDRKEYQIGQDLPLAPEVL